jgi:hypothetical protein
MLSYSSQSLKCPHTWGTGIYTPGMVRARVRVTRVHWNSEQNFGAVQMCNVFLPDFFNWKWHALIIRCYIPPDVPLDLLSSVG